MAERRRCQLPTIPDADSDGDNDAVLRGLCNIRFDRDAAIERLSIESDTGATDAAVWKHVTYEDVPITPLDHVIATHGGSTSNIERLRGEMERSKNCHLTPEEKTLELTRENSRLRAEVAHLQEVRRVMMELYAGVAQTHKELVTVHRKLNRQLQRSSQGLTASDQDYLRYWGIFIDPQRQDFQIADDF